MSDLEVISEKIIKVLDNIPTHSMPLSTHRLQITHHQHRFGNCNFCHASNTYGQRYQFRDHFGNQWMCDSCAKKTWAEIAVSHQQVGGTRPCIHCGSQTTPVIRYRFKTRTWNQHFDIACCSECKISVAGLPETKTKIKRILSSAKTTATKKKEVDREEVRIYMDLGLAEPFAAAIVSGSPEDEIMELWVSDWWKQYPADDPLIVSVLEGKHPEETARWLNGIRSDHERLAMEVVDGTVEVEWAHAVMDAGFGKSPEAVVALLDGGRPSLVAKLSKLKEGLEVDMDILPPQLGVSAKSGKKSSATSGPKRKSASQTAEYKSYKDQLKKWKAPQVKAIIKKSGITGYSKMTSNEMRGALQSAYLNLSNYYINGEDPLALPSDKKKKLGKKLGLPANDLDNRIHRLIQRLGVRKNWD
tara:strand:+ start:8136 stop:9380 length:1245 start_codon:yes stop_codon:yes gene_type:complete